jgi:hypothetical protein
VPPLLLWAVDAAAVETPLYAVPYVGGAVSAFHPDSARDSDPAGAGYQLSGGWPVFSNHEAIEARLLDHQHRRKLGQSDNNYQTSLFFDYVYDFGSAIEGSAGFFHGTKFFVGAGLGAVQEDNFGKKGTFLGVDVNGGVLVPLGWKGWAIRIDARVQGEMNKDTCSRDNVNLGYCTKEKSYLVDSFFSAGLQIPLTIFFDKAIVPESAEDCPVAVVDPNSGRRDCGGRGSDGDGDGVVDTADKCPSTASGFSVTRDGCLAAQNVDLPSSLFDGKAGALTPEGRKRVDDIAIMLGGEPNVVVSIRSLSGGAGSAGFNEMLAQKRVDALTTELQNKGVTAAPLPADAAASANAGKIELQLTVTP